jgi:hypothetical protein
MLRKIAKRFGYGIPTADNPVPPTGELALYEALLDEGLNIARGTRFLGEINELARVNRMPERFVLHCESLEIMDSDSRRTVH